jgi:hypothetical protein
MDVLDLTEQCGPVKVKLAPLLVLIGMAMANAQDNALDVIESLELERCAGADA